MSAEDNGGPAFPIISGSEAAGLWNPSDGMSMRDHFAGLALQGICSHTDTWGLQSDESIAKACYGIADWMLKVRNL